MPQTEAMTMAAKAARGSCANSGVSHSRATTMVAAHANPLTCVRPPAAALTLERLKLPATG